MCIRDRYMKGLGALVQWLRQDETGSETYPLNGSVVQRLQRFATYGSLKQQVLRIITDELAISNDQGKTALKKVRCACPADDGCIGL